MRFIVCGYCEIDLICMLAYSKAIENYIFAVF